MNRLLVLLRTLAGKLMLFPVSGFSKLSDSGSGNR